MTSEELREVDFGDERVAELRRQVAALMEEERLSAGLVGREADVGQSTVAAFMKGTYNGNNAAVSVKLAKWLSARAARIRTTATFRRAPGFVVTPAARAFFAVMEHAQFAPDFCVIVGEPGVGKTSAAMHYQAQTRNVWMITGEKCATTPGALLMDLAEAVGLGSVDRELKRISRAIVRKVRDTGGLIVADEAQNWSSDALDQLRTIHDLSGLGVVMIGNPTIYARLEGGTKRANFAQLYSRLGMRVTRPRATKADVDALLDAWALTDTACRDLCHVAAGRGGALRSMTKALRQGFLRADAEGEELAEKHLRAAMQQLGVSTEAAQ